jgi:hypothetical protein
MFISPSEGSGYRLVLLEAAFVRETHFVIMPSPPLVGLLRGKKGERMPCCNGSRAAGFRGKRVPEQLSGCSRAGSAGRAVFGRVGKSLLRRIERRMTLHPKLKNSSVVRLV